MADLVVVRLGWGSKPGYLQGDLEDQAQWALLPLQIVTVFTWSLCWASHKLDGGSKSESSKKQKVAPITGPGNYHGTTLTTL